MLAKLHAAVLVVLAFFGLAHSDSTTYQGYAEGEYVLVAPQIAGTLETLSVTRGQTVHKGDALFVLEHADETAALDQAKAEAARSQSTLADLTKGKRQSEIDTLNALRDQASAALKLAEVTYNRDTQQLKINAVSKQAVDADLATLEQARAHLAQTEADVKTGELSTGREDAIRAAEADIAASDAAVTSAQWKLDQKTLTAPVDAFVFDTLYRQGEFISSGTPVVSLLPAANIKARFFVPEPVLASVSAGSKVQIHCDSCAEMLPAHVTYVSPQAEYSPPELYNRDNREKLLFMLEAVPDEKPELLHPGQPVDVVVGGE